MPKRNTEIRPPLKRNQLEFTPLVFSVHGLIEISKTGLPATNRNPITKTDQSSHKMLFLCESQTGSSIALSRATSQNLRGARRHTYKLIPASHATETSFLFFYYPSSFIHLSPPSRTRRISSTTQHTAFAPAETYEQPTGDTRRTDFLDD